MFHDCEDLVVVPCYCTCLRLRSKLHEHAVSSDEQLRFRQLSPTRKLPFHSPDRHLFPQAIARPVSQEFNSNKEYRGFFNYRTWNIIRDTSKRPDLVQVI